MKQALQAAQNGLEQPSQSRQLAEGEQQVLYVPEGGHTTLIDLLNSGFHMAASDRDYKLSHEQLIKVCKVLLHKLNCVDYKNHEGREEQNKLAKELYKQAERNTQS